MNFRNSENVDKIGCGLQRCFINVFSGFRLFSHLNPTGPVVEEKRKGTMRVKFKYMKSKTI